MEEFPELGSQTGRASDRSRESRQVDRNNGTDTKDKESPKEDDSTGASKEKDRVQKKKSKMKKRKTYVSLDNLEFPKKDALVQKKSKDGAFKISSPRVDVAPQNPCMHLQTTGITTGVKTSVVSNSYSVDPDISPSFNESTPAQSHISSEGTIQKQTPLRGKMTDNSPVHDSKKRTRAKPKMIPMPVENLGFKTRRSHTFPKKPLRENLNLGPFKGSPKRGKKIRSVKKKENVIPTIETDGSDDSDASDECEHHWLQKTSLSIHTIGTLLTKQSSVVGLTLARNLCSLLNFMENDEKNLENHVDLLHVLATGCSCNVIERSVCQIVTFLGKEQLFDNYIKWVFTEINHDPYSVEPILLSDLFRYAICILNSQSVTSTGSDPTIRSRIYLMAMARKLKQHLGDYHEEIYLKLQVQKEQKAEASSDAIMSSDENFRNVPIMPTNDDINPTLKPVLKVNKVKGSYTDVNDYLDTQFRLLREDFIQPLRDGISEYQDIINSKDRRAIRLYRNVKVKRIICSENGIVYRFQFDVGKFPQVDWGNTRRLMYGSMICMSSDTFKTVRFAIVSDRKPERLRYGYVDVKFEKKVKLDSKISFSMVETPALFEAYRHIFLGLQRVDTDSLPFQRYFVECEAPVEKPCYLEQNLSSYYDLKTVVSKQKDNDTMRHAVASSDDDSSDDGMFLPTSKVIDILCENAWPKAAALGMDQSQYRAFKTALTKELVIIQGPPGTGKTYVGLKIMRTLLSNRSNWNCGKNKPLLVVCYTNHALDQFLEGIASFFNGNILRVGGRSKSEVLLKYNINKRRGAIYRGKCYDGEIDDIVDIRQTLKDDFLTYQNAIEEHGQQIDSTACGILHESHLRLFMGKHYRMIKNTHPNAASALLEWLEIKGIGKSTTVSENRRHVARTSDDEGETDEVQRQRRVDDVDEDIQEQTFNLRFLRQQRLALSLDDCDLPDKAWNAKYKSTMKSASRKILKDRLKREILTTTKMDQSEAERIPNVLDLPIDKRWTLYRYWVDQFCQKLQRIMEPLQPECQDAADRFKEANGLVDKHIFEHSDVIGMTTTGAARYHSILTDIRPPVVVVEEAAEVLEGHIVTSLSPGCQHLILIGDHKQLRPNPNVYELAKRYNLDLSLFERMINNGLHCDTLELQHRMRPSISRILRHIYVNLRDHESVETYPDVMGISQNIFFMNHNVPETENAELQSHLNRFEAEYMAKLCEYLLKQGYEPSQITVLSAYSAQVSCLRSLMGDEVFTGVQITAVDNYQGEENDIVLLSLVRSNEERNIGFLKIDNRICVALSRARMGLYVIGDFDLLASHSTTWKNIVDDLKQTGQIGPGLPIYCQTHPKDKGSVISEGGNFSRHAPEGGCLKPCTFALNCGHGCRRKCHAYDPKHEFYDCLEPCQKTCSNGHPCTGRCSEQCPPCGVNVPKLIPGCEHTDQVPCHLDPEDHTCLQPCEEILDCGHCCGNNCGLDHVCYTTVTKEWPCGHAGEVLCMVKDTALCQSKCSTRLECGHICQGFCHDCAAGRLHIPCAEKCEKILLCGHQCQSTCSRCPPCNMDCENVCEHIRCDKKCSEQCQQCTEPCKWACSHYKCFKKCHEACDRPRCDKRCRKSLKCKHTCIGLCGEICSDLCRKCNAEDVRPFLPEGEDISTARFIKLSDCGHIVEYKSLDAMMDNEDERNAIQLPCCPWCNVPIRRNPRYNEVIHTKLTTLREIMEIVKEFETNQKEKYRMMIKEGIEMVSSSEKGWSPSRDAADVQDFDVLTVLMNQTAYLVELTNTTTRFSKQKSDIGFSSDIDDMIATFKDWLLIKRHVFTDQESQDARYELKRITCSLFLQRMVCCLLNAADTQTGRIYTDDDDDYPANDDGPAAAGDFDDDDDEDVEDGAKEVVYSEDWWSVPTNTPPGGKVHFHSAQTDQLTKNDETSNESGSEDSLSDEDYGAIGYQPANVQHAILDEASRLLENVLSCQSFTSDLLQCVLQLQERWVELHPEDSDDLQFCLQDVPRWNSPSWDGNLWSFCSKCNKHVKYDVRLDDKTSIGCIHCLLQLQSTEDVDHQDDGW